MNAYKGINGDPAQVVRERIASMTLTERAQCKLGYDVRYGSRLVVYGACYKCQRTKCDDAINGLMKCNRAIQ